MQFFRYILFPFALLYGGIVWIRNKCFDWGILKSESFDIPVICVGNLNVGGTGKSPMIDYLIRLLKNDFKLATLSRGYKRETQGFQLVFIESSAKAIGDEPLQFKTNHPEVLVAVDEKRVHGIEKLLQLEQSPNLVLLDDAFQHRYVKAGFNILLTAYNDLYADDFMLPTGNLREPKSGANRANVVIVTKCPKALTIEKKLKVRRKLDLKPNQSLFFSKISYSETIRNAGEERLLSSLFGTQFSLVTGIANPKPLIDYLSTLNLNFEHLNYPDHHNFSEEEISSLKTKSLIITTEKDYMRLSTKLNDDILFYLPIRIVIEDEVDFKTILMDGLQYEAH